MRGVRPDIAGLEQNGITGVAAGRLDDPDVIPLWFGEGDLPTPDFIRRAAIEALDRGETFYTYTRGLPELRDAIDHYLTRTYGIELDPDRISVPGSSMLGVNMAVQMALRPGDQALVVAPYWPNIEIACRITGAEVMFVRQRETPEGWQLTADDIIEAATPATRCLYVNSPCNPTGWVMTREDQEQLLAFCRERNILLIADEVYHRHVEVDERGGGAVAPSFIEIARDDDPVVIINGLSKAWAMTGWRVGWVVAPLEQATLWAIMSECFNTGATVFAQHGAIAALADGEAAVAALRRQYQAARQIVIERLGNHPAITLAPPAGAFYAFPRISGVTNSRRFAEALLAAKDVGVAPGYTFGEGNDSHIRVCYALSHDRLKTGLDRILEFVDEYRE